MKPTLTIVGSSARAAAQSAAAAGFFVHAADLFADVDLRQHAAATQLRHYPAEIESIIRGPQTGPWLYTGALENNPELIAVCATQRPLAGNSGEVLRAVRNPFLLQDFCKRHGFRYPAISPTPPAAPGDGNWLVKPFCSAGGSGIHRHEFAVPNRGAVARDQSSSDTTYYQRFVVGDSYSGAYLSEGHNVFLLGVTQQLAGGTGDSLPDFRYHGSIGPAQISRERYDQFEHIGRALVKEFGLQGLFGVDAIVDHCDVWVIEVNPRYTASMEIIETLLGMPLVAAHLSACLQRKLPAPRQVRGNKFAGKAVVYADQPFTVTLAFSERLSTVATPELAWADIPVADTHIEKNGPIATALAQGTTLVEVQSKLRQAARWLTDLAAQSKRQHT